MEAFRDAARLWWEHIWLCLGIVAAVWLPAALALGLAAQHSDGLWAQVDSWTGLAASVSTAALLAALAGRARVSDSLVEARPEPRPEAPPGPPGALSFGGSMTAGLRAWSRLVVAAFCARILTVLGFLLLLVPGMVLLVRLSLVQPVVVLEGAGVRQALRRSFELTRGRTGEVVGVALRAFAVVLVVFLLAQLVSIPAEATSPVIAVGFVHFAIGVGLAFLATCFLCLYRRFLLAGPSEGAESPVAEAVSGAGEPPPGSSRHLWLLPLVILASLAPALQSSLWRWVDVPARSMSPTLVPGDRVLITGTAYDLRLPFTRQSLIRWGDPQRGDVILLHSPEDDALLAKRVIGIPGDEIRMEGARLSIDGVDVRYTPFEGGAPAGIPAPGNRDVVAMWEDLGTGPHAVWLGRLGAPGTSGPFVLGEGEYFVLGDNRGNSRDSRYFGSVERSAVLGRIDRVVFSIAFEPFGIRGARFWSPVR
ncbi:MAG: signal peptidase I [Holophagales bacterium]|nr:signal peptidase I [Holophagales bacterium]